MNSILFHIGDTPLRTGDAALLLGALATLLLLIMLLVMWGGSRRRAADEAAREAAAAERAHELDDKLAALNQLQAALTGRMQSMAEIFGNQQGDLVKSLSERLDGLQHRMGQGLESATQRTTDTLGALNERLAVIDAAQKNLTTLTSEVVGLKDVLANKQSRGAYGQARMEAIVRDGLPAGAFEFQVTLANNKRPDCIIRLPGDPRPLVVDAKFPLESFTALRDATSDDARKLAQSLVRAHVGVHIKDIADKYVTSSDTQDMALLFVPSEAIYADLMEHFDDIIQKAHRARVIIVSPSLMMMAVQLMQTLMRDHRMREEARVIQKEVSMLVQDVRRLGERTGNLAKHFQQVQGDLSDISTSSEKITRRGTRLESMDFDEPAQAALPIAARLRAVE